MLGEPKESMLDQSTWSARFVLKVKTMSFMKYHQNNKVQLKAFFSTTTKIMALLEETLDQEATLLVETGLKVRLIAQLN